MKANAEETHSLIINHINVDRQRPTRGATRVVKLYIT